MYFWYLSFSPPIRKPTQVKRLYSQVHVNARVMETVVQGQTCASVKVAITDRRVTQVSLYLLK